jgi:hypothetical protein
MRVTTVNDDVTLLEVGNELLDEGIDGRASLDEEDDLTGALELRDELLDRVSTLNVCACKACVRVFSREVGSARDKVLPFASFWRKWSTLLVVRLYATTVKPLSFMLRIRF